MAKLLKKAKVILVIGGPGSGKRTTCQKLAENPAIKHFSVGQLLRKEIEEDTEIGKKAKPFVDRGELVPTNIIIQLLKENMIKEAATTKEFLIDGFPKDASQSAAFEKEIAPIARVIYLKATDETMKARCMERAGTEGRTDDTEELIATRIATHNMNIKAMTTLYAKKKKLNEVDAEGDNEAIFIACKAAVEKKKWNSSVIQWLAFALE